MHPVCDERGQVIQLAVHSRDITEEKKSEDERRKLTIQLQQAQKMEAIGTLAGGIAHDFNNLLMAIQGNVSLMLFDTEPSHPHHRTLTNIEKLIRSGADLTSKLLGYARKGKYESRPLLLNDLLQETAETFGRMRKDIRIEWNLAPDLKGIIADRGQVEQVLLNLFVNASDAMPGGGKLFLKTDTVTHREIPRKGYAINPGAYVRLTVADTGVGIDKDIIGRIFDPFFTTKKMGRGTGLGLASAYGIVKSHNGYIDVVSEKGQGATFSVYFPATDARPAVAAEKSCKPEEGVGTILLVDDEAVVLEVTAAMIRRLGYTVLTAPSGREAVENLHRARRPHQRRDPGHDHARNGRRRGLRPAQAHQPARESHPRQRLQHGGAGPGNHEPRLRRISAEAVHPGGYFGPSAIPDRLQLDGRCTRIHPVCAPWTFAISSGIAEIC